MFIEAVFLSVLGVDEVIYEYASASASVLTSLDSIHHSTARVIAADSYSTYSYNLHSNKKWWDRHFYPMMKCASSPPSPPSPHL